MLNIEFKTSNTYNTNVKQIQKPLKERGNYEKIFNNI